LRSPGLTAPFLLFYHVLNLLTVILEKKSNVRLYKKEALQTRETITHKKDSTHNHVSVITTTSYSLDENVKVSLLLHYNRYM